MTKVSELNSIGLAPEKSKELADVLNTLLADYSVFYQNTRGFHWNIQGNKFFELHVKFEELYNDLLIKIDDIAERILTLGYRPIHSYSDFIRISEIEEAKDVSEGNSAVGKVLEAFKILLYKQRTILNMAGDLDDEGTSALMSDNIREQEKLVWMYSAFLAV